MLKKAILAVLLVVLSASMPLASDLKAGWDEYRKGNYLAAVDILMPLAKAGNPRAQYAIGYMHQKGNGLPQDKDEANKWFRKALPGLTEKAENGSRSTQHLLSIIYRRGYGVEKDEEIAAEWNLKAAKQGHSLAQYNMGWAYAHGRGVPWNEKKAIKWYEKAAAQGNPSAANNIGAIYHNGETIQKDPIKALMWYKIATSIGKDNLTSHKKARKLATRNMETRTFKEEMMLGDIEKANRLAADWLKKHKK